MIICLISYLHFLVEHFDLDLYFAKRLNIKCFRNVSTIVLIMTATLDAEDFAILGQFCSFFFQMLLASAKQLMVVVGTLIWFLVKGAVVAGVILKIGSPSSLLMQQ